jgi:protein-disulfide isomerase
MRAAPSQDHGTWRARRGGSALVLAAVGAALALGGCARAAGEQAGAVARVDGRAISDAQLSAEAKSSLDALAAKHEQEVHDAKARALDGLIERSLLEAEAKKRSLTVDALLAQEVAGKVVEPDEVALRAVYDATKANGRPLPSFEKVRGEIAEFVRNESRQNAHRAFVARLSAEAKVENLLPPYIPAAVSVKADGPSRGRADAPVTVVVFSDFQCPYCRSAGPSVRRLLDAYKDDVRLVAQEFPLSTHPDAPKAAEAALCAGEQGRYWAMYDALFSSPDALKPDDLKRHAASIGLDAGAFAACLDSGRMAAAVASSQKLGERLGVEGTPAFFINGRPLKGGQPFERLKEIVDFELAAEKR